MRVTHLNKLKDAGLRSLVVGLHSDGGGLYLRVSGTGARSWVFIWRGGGRRREMGLGGYPTVSLAEARRRAAEARALRARNICPLAEKRSTAPVSVPPTTFREVAQATIDRLSPGWRGKTKAQWERSLFKYAAPLGPLRPADIDLESVLSVLRPLWENQHSSAQKCRSHLEAVLDAAKVMGLRRGDNPARWEGNLKHLLPPARRLVSGHHRALPYGEAPQFWRALNARTGVPERLLEFILLTGVRYSEAAGARWEEIDGDVWTVPAGRMKGKRPHSVPLSTAALAVLDRVRGLDEDFVFGHRLSAPTVYARLVALGVADKTTVHGLRSTFRDWGGNETAYAREVLEEALAHVVGSEVERAYRRGDALAKRRLLMSCWAQYLREAPADQLSEHPGRLLAVN